MVMNEEGQLYTIEGIAAAVLILTTVYLVLSSTMVFTPGETHIYEMPLEQLVDDVLAAMDQPVTGYESKSPLELAIENNDTATFKNTFLHYSNMRTGPDDTLQFNATISYYDGTQVNTIPFAKSRDYNRENAVKVTRWVNINGASPNLPSDLNLGGQNHTVLLEVLLWRG